jgi:hypothetical protein
MMELPSGREKQRCGFFCIVIPKYDPEFKLVYRAAGYFAYVSPEPMKNNYDPTKVEKVLLRKKDPKDNAQLEMIDELLETEFAIYRDTKSPSLRRALREELMKLSEAIEIPPIDPTLTIFDSERKMRIKARFSIDTVVAKMK